MIKIKPEIWSWRLPLEVIFLGIILFFLIVQIISTDSDHWLFGIIQIPTWFFNPLTWCYLFLRQWANNIGWHGFFIDIPQWTYWLQTQAKCLIVQSNFKALLASEVVNFKPKTPRSELGKSLVLTGYMSGLTYITWSHLD